MFVSIFRCCFLAHKRINRDVVIPGNDLCGIFYDDRNHLKLGQEKF